MGLSSLWKKLLPDPEVALARARQELDDALPLKVATLPLGHEAWACYRRALAAARKCGSDAVTSLVLEFDLRFPSEPATGFPLCDPYLGPALISKISSVGPFPLYRALKILLANQPVPDQAIEAAYRLAIRLGDNAQIRRVEHLIQQSPGAEAARRAVTLCEALGHNPGLAINFLEAGLQAELRQDYVTAGLMFEEAGAFEQARHAFDRSPRSELQRGAELLERDGDFSRAGRLYQLLGQTEKVSEMQDMDFDQGGFCAVN